jgi:hypothetical protein
MLTIALIVGAVWIALLIVVVSLGTAASRSDDAAERAHFYLQYELRVARQRRLAPPPTTTTAIAAAGDRQTA